MDAYELKDSGERPDKKADYDKNKPYYEGRDPRFEKTIAKKIWHRRDAYDFLSVCAVAGFKL